MSSSLIKWDLVEMRFLCSRRNLHRASLQYGHALQRVWGHWTYRPCGAACVWAADLVPAARRVVQMLRSRRAAQKVVVVAGKPVARDLRKMSRAETTVDYYDREKG